MLLSIMAPIPTLASSEHKQKCMVPCFVVLEAAPESDWQMPVQPEIASGKGFALGDQSECPQNLESRSAPRNQFFQGLQLLTH